ncbi:MAG: hypothetical protein H0T73_05165 [Ardenticatenales bacterium]|nr:hypothetical protein [Ardenticatenales bacterium]
MQNRSRWGVLLLVLAFLLIACTVTPTPASPNDVSAPQPTETTETEEEEVEPLAATPIPSPEEETEMEEQPGPGEIAITELVLEHVAAETGLDRETLTVSEVEAVEWPNAGLGCPQPEQMYIEVITPGYLLQVKSGEEVFKVHTNKDGSVIVICPKLEAVVPEGETTNGGDSTAVPAGSDPLLPPALSGEAAEVAARAIEKVTGESGLARTSLTVTSYSQEMWSDSGLGCRKAGQMYMQVITPGYKFVIQGEGETFNVHTDRTGNSIIICR